MSQIEWIEFEPALLEQARRSNLPVFMVLTTPWCPHSRELLETSLQDAEVVARLRGSFLCCQVDAERRPDVNSRYGSGGWPTIAWLTPDGELISHDRFLDRAQLLDRIDRVLELFHRAGSDIQREIRRSVEERESGQAEKKHGKLNQRMVQNIAEMLYDRADHRYGGWGDGSKFPHPEAIDFAMVVQVKRGDANMETVARTALRRMMESALHDTVDGGFFRFSVSADWQKPHHEKVLDSNAQLLRNYLEAYQVHGDEAYRKTAEGIVRWLLEQMLDRETGAFCGSLDADSDYYHLDAEQRKLRQPPRRDPTIYANGNAMAVSSLLKAAVTLQRPELRDVAMRALTFILERLFREDVGVYHYWDGTYHLPGLLSDQAYTIRALVDASQHTGDADYLMPAEAIAEVALDKQAAPGGFFDIRHDPAYTGSMRRRNRSILENSVMAESLVRLGYLSRRQEFQDEAVRALECFAGDYKQYGHFVAGYGRAVDLLFYEPLMITIVGDRGRDVSEQLRRAALASYVPSRIVQTLDPVRDPVLLARSGHVAADGPAAFLSIGKTTKAVARSADELTARIDELERERRQS